MMKFQRITFLIVLIAFTRISMSENPAPATTQSVPSKAFVHPGALHTLEDLQRMKSKIATGEHPWIDGWNLLIKDPKAQNSYRANPKPNMGVSRQRAQDDATSAYLNAMRWYISGDTTFADCAVRNLNGWSNAVNQLPSGTDQPGLSGIPIGSFALAAEVLRLYPGWADADQQKFKAMLLTYFYPVCHDFLTRHNNAPIDHYWANWDTANMLAIMAIGVFCDDQAKFDEAVEYFKNGQGNGSIKNAVYFLHPGNLGQWQEAGRDHAHALGGLGLLAEMCQVAWNQNLDLFGYDNNRLLAGAEYEAQYTLWKGVPYKSYTNSVKANQFYISSNYHGRLGNCQFYELLYNHYVIRKGLNAPNVKTFAELIRPEGGNADILGYGTLTYTLDAKASPFPPSPNPPTPLDLMASAGVGRVELSWSPSGAYSAQGYNVQRSTTSTGPFESIFSTSGNTTPQITDTKVISGTTYYYTVSALNQSGASENSSVVSATPVSSGKLPEQWIEANLGLSDKPGESSFAEAAGNTILISGFGDDVGGTQDNARYIYQKASGDFSITARLFNRNNMAYKTGLMLRESTDPDSPSMAITLGEVGGRQARFAMRSKKSEKTSVIPGNDYTWLPIWMRLQRIGDNITASQSPDGITWYEIGASKVTMNKDFLVGLMICNGRDKPESAKATFDHVTTEIAPPSPPDAPQELKAERDNQSIILRWKNGDKIFDGIKIECAVDSDHFYEIADLQSDVSKFVNTSIGDRTYAYRIRAYHSGGYSEYSNIAHLTR